VQENQTIKFSLLFLLLLVAAYLSLFFGGSSSFGAGDVVENEFIFWQIRFPKTITAIIAGSTLSVAGLILQIIFRNPLAGPYVLGISSGASLMVAFGILAGNSISMTYDFLLGKTFIVVCAVAGSFFVTLLILAVSKKVQNNIVLLLIGLMFSQICGAIQISLEYFADPNSLKSFVVWGMGSLANTTNKDLYVYAPVAILFVAAMTFFIKPLNALLLGQSYATNLGINFGRSRFYLILISSVLTGVTTAFCGPIAFVGIAVPILSRMIFKTSKQHIHFVSCILLGSIILLFSDSLSNTVMSGVTLPINMITTLIGAPLVIYLMFKNKQW
jgi:iron complex transport system permease protein